MSGRYLETEARVDIRISQRLRPSASFAKNATHNVFPDVAEHAHPYLLVIPVISLPHLSEVGSREPLGQVAEPGVEEEEWGQRGLWPALGDLYVLPQLFWGHGRDAGACHSQD